MEKNFKSLESIELAVFDVDGIMTDARIAYGANGEWWRFFSVRDGIGIKNLQKAGVLTAVITGANSQDVRKRVEHLKIHYFFENKSEKIDSFAELLDKTKLKVHQVSYMGDDLPDIPLLKKAGFAATVPEAVDEVKKECDYITECRGGYGAVREVSNLILRHRRR